MEFYHLLEYNKFAAASIAQFESAFPKENHYIFLKGTKEEIEALHPNFDFSLLNDWNWKSDRHKLESKRIVAHSLNHRISRLLYGLKMKELVWLVYGAEVYNNRLVNGMDSWKSDKWTENLKQYVDYQWYLFKSLAARLRGITTSDLIQKEMIRRADRVGLLFEEEFEHFRSLKVLKPESSFFPYTFYPLGKVIKEEAAIGKERSKVLIGNSANTTSLITPVIPFLAKQKGLGWTFIFPLSYGDNDYMLKIEEMASSKLGTDAFFLKEFMPLAQYEELLEEVGIAIFNARRQQGVGNVLSLIMKGARLYLNSNSTIYAFLKRIGVRFNDVEELKSIDHDLKLLSEQEKKSNQEIISQLIDYNLVVNKLKIALKEDSF